MIFAAHAGNCRGRNMTSEKFLIYIISSCLLVFGFGLDGSFAYEKTFRLDHAGMHEMSFELDPYYSNIAYVHALTEKPIPRETYKKERSVYFYLLRNIYHPRYMLVEASIYPFPIAGVYLKKNQEDFYERNQYTQNFNAVKAITAGFPEPWAYSFFLGNVVDFVRGENDKKVVGKGYSGFLLSYGSKHIVDNIMVDDHWYEAEVKLKGSDIREKRNLSWSYALGYKGHRNIEIRDALYISIKRSRIDYIESDANPFWKFFVNNSEQEIRLDFDVREVQKGKIIRYLFLFGKKFVLARGKFTFSFSLGAFKTLTSGYSGKLEQNIDDHWTFILRPNVHIKF